MILLSSLSNVNEFIVVGHKYVLLDVAHVNVDFIKQLILFFPSETFRCILKMKFNVGRVFSLDQKPETRHHEAKSHFFI